MSTAARLASSAVNQSEVLLFHTLLQLTAIVRAGRLGGAVALRLGQSAAPEPIAGAAALAATAEPAPAREGLTP